MLRISKESWDEVVDWYFRIPQKYKKFSLQLYPFYRKENQSILKSNDFFENVIKNGYFVQDSQIIEVGRNFMQRKDASFRNTQLLSPILFLLLETIGLDIYKCYSVRFEHPVEVYYAGNYEEKSVYYRNSYQKFYKKTQELSQDFDKYIKFDIKNFFSSINLNVLFNQIAEGNAKFTEVDYFIMREFLLFLGEGKYPVVENSAALSYLSTKIYLEKSDSLLSKYLDKQKWIRNWHGIRFVDDLYIFYNSKNNDDSSHLWELIKIYDDILFEFDLQLNMEKISYDSTLSIAKVVKQTSFANDYYERVGVDFPRGKFTNFLKKLYIKQQKTRVTVEDYYSIMDEILYLQTGKISSLEIFHSMLYDKRFEKYFQHEDVKKLISGLTELEFISNDVSRLTALVLKTNKENNAKKILNDLFYKSKSEGWTRHDLSIANAYLLQKNVEHLDLLEHVKQHDKKLYNYYKLYCAGRKTSSNWAEVILLSDKVILENKFKISNRTEQLYFLYLKNRHLKDWLIAYSYYKSYFDRKTAEFAGYLEKEKPNYKAFYNRNKLCEFYSSISGSQEIIKQAHRNRNRNPSIHGKAELLSLDSEHKELIKIIEKLEALLLKKKEEIS